MFRKILSWVREWIKKMIGKQTVDKALNIEVAFSSKMAEEIELWARMYENKAPWLNADVKSMGLPAAIASELARLTTIEMEAKFTGGARATWLEEQFGRVMDKLRHQVEFGCAKGGLVFKPYIVGEQLAIDFVQADQFYPVAFDAAGMITALVFVDQRRQGDYWYKRLEYHNMTDAG